MTRGPAKAKAKTLLEEAKHQDSYGRFMAPSEEDLDVIVAWFKGEIGMGAAGDAVAKGGHIAQRAAFYSYAATRLRAAIIMGKAKLTGPSSKG